MPTTDTPTPADQLHAYYQLSDRAVPGGFAWPKEITPKPYTTPDGTNVEVWFYEDDIIIKIHHALAIVERAAEDHLKSKEWNIMYSPRLGRTWYEPSTWGFMECWKYGETHDPHSLPAALAAENGRGG